MLRQQLGDLKQNTDKNLIQFVIINDRIFSRFIDIVNYGGTIIHGTVEGLN